MRVGRALLLTILLSSAAASAVAAEDENTASDSPGGFKEEVVVTATRDQVARDKSPGSVTVISREEIARSAARTVDDLLRRVPGFSLFRRSSSLVAHPTTHGASLRYVAPSGAGRALVLVDGIPVNDAFGGWVHWGRLPLETIERIEILEGGASSLWGSQALAGVVNIITRGIPDRPQYTAGVEAGTHDTRGATLRAARRHDRIGWSMAGSLRDTDGWEIVRPDQAGPIDIAAFSEMRHATGEIDRVTEAARIFARAGWSDEDRGNGTPLTHNATRFREMILGADRNGATGRWQARVFARDQAFDSTFSAQDPGRAFETPALDQHAVESNDVGASLQWSGDIGRRHRLTAGSDLRVITGETRERFLWSGMQFLRRREAGGDQAFAGIFVQDRVAFGDDLTVHLAIRGETWIDADGFRRETEIATGSRLRDEAFDDRREAALSPRVDLVWRAAEAVIVRGAVYRSFRAPTINELYRPFRVRDDITEANGRLSPETLTGGEAGVAFGEGALSGRVTLYGNRVGDAVANVTLAEAPAAMTIAPCGFVPAGGTCRQRRNLDEVTVRGIAAGIAYQPAPEWAFTIDWLAGDARVTRAAAHPDLEDRRLAQTPRHEGTAAITWDRDGAIGARLQGRYVGDQFEDDLERRRLDDFIVADLSIWGRLGGSAALRMGVENLFDREYEAGVSGAGLVTTGMPRRIHVGVTLTLDGGP